MDEQKIDKVSLMKINIEGSEYDLLERLINKSYHKKIDNILVQFHNISVDSEKRLLQIRDELSKTHKSTFCYNFVWENWELNSK